MNTVRLVCVALWMIVLSAVNAAAQQYIDEYLAKPDFKAMAESSSGTWGASWGYCSLDDAMNDALSSCTTRLKGLQDGVCQLTRVGSNFIGGLPQVHATQIANRYRKEIETVWLEASRKGAYLIDALLYGGKAEEWDNFVPGNIRANPKAICLAEILANGPFIQCSGTARFAGYLNKDSKYPTYGEVRLQCSNGQNLNGESVSLTPGVGFGCANTNTGGRVMIIFGPGSHNHATSDAAFLRVYETMVLKSGLDHELCGWGLLVS